MKRMDCYSLKRKWQHLSLMILLLQKFNFCIYVAAEGAPRKLAIADHKRIVFTQVKQELELKCPIENSATTFVDWHRDSEDLYMSYGYEITETGVLRIKSVSKEHAGTYTCEGVNGYGYIRVNITVLVENIEVEHENNTSINPNSVNRMNFFPPTIKKRTLTHFNDDVGGQATFHCVASGHPIPHIFWLKNGHLINDAETEISKGRVLSTLKLRGLQSSDAGTYKCIARNKAGEDQMDFTLDVKETPKPPLIVSLEPPLAIIKEGEAALFWCEVQSKPGLKLHIKWLKRLNKEEIDDSVNSDTSKLFRSGTTFYRPLNLSDSTSTDTGFYKSKLLIRNSRKEDSGIYVCLALNDKGFNFKNVTLTVISTAKSNYSPSYFVANETSFVITIIIALVIVLSAIILVSHLYCRGKSQKRIIPRTVIGVECGNMNQNSVCARKQGKPDTIFYPDINDPQLKSKPLCSDSSYSYETENQVSKSLHVKTYIH